MRIQQIRFKNLNSLAGEWTIDFKNPAFEADGIFAIIGPTGAGKSTILDAICLSLYGSTPRLNKVTKSTNEIMSRQTGECFSEVTFETQEDRFRCYWSQRRAGNKPDGNLQAPQHEISKHDTGEILVTGIAGVANKVEYLTGMDFSRFTRSMMLAQGDFAAFLNAKPKERAPILEQITGTEVYSDISIAVHERRTIERSKLEKLKFELENIHVLTRKEEKRIRRKLQAKQAKLRKVTAKIDKTGKAIQWRETIDQLEKVITGLKQSLEELQIEIDNFAPKKVRLKRANQALRLAVEYQKLSGSRQRLQGHRDSVEENSSQIRVLEPQVENLSAKLKEAIKVFEKAKATQETIAPVITEVRLIDDRIRVMRDSIQSLISKIHTMQEEIESLDKQFNAEKKELNSIEEQIEATAAYLRTDEADKWLVENLQSVKADISNLNRVSRDIQNNISEHDELRGDCDEAKILLHERKESLSTLEKTLKREQNNYDENRLQLDRLQVQIDANNTSVVLGELQAKLKDGEPCPVCGSTEHKDEKDLPEFPSHVLDSEEINSLINQREELKEEIKKLEEITSKASNAVSAAEYKVKLSSQDITAKQSSLLKIRRKLEELRTEYEIIESNILDQLKPLGVVSIPEDAIELYVELIERRDSWTTHVERKIKLQEQRTEIQARIDGLQAKLNDRKQSVDELQDSLDKEERKCSAKERKRQDLFGDKNPDEEEEALRQAVKHAEETKQKVEEEFREKENELLQARTKETTLLKEIANEESNLQELEPAFEVALKTHGFTDEKDFCDARLTQHEIGILETEFNDLNERKVSLEAQIKDAESKLRTEKDKKITDKSLEDLQARLDEYKCVVRKISERIGALEQNLEDNEKAKEGWKIKKEQVDAQQKEHDKWNNLHAIIGSADGNKYRSFVQGLTFEVMIYYANEQLKKMTDRYVLTREEHQPLEINVIDNYQAGEIRTAKNLSGGEGFIVSLSLALGLSHMASQNVSVDSLFLDEGFGTLDEEALDIALDTLTGLQAQGKLIGLISHVPALRERINTQIRVTQQSGGKSRIDGPGCKGINVAY